MNVLRKVGSVINAAAKFTACNRNALWFALWFAVHKFLQDDKRNS